MMAALVRRSATDGGALAILCRSLGVVRFLSDGVSTASGGAEEAVDGELEKKKRRKRKNLFEVAKFLPNWGLGFKMAKTHWRDVSYELTKINLYKDGRHGKAWGIRYKAGQKIAADAVKMSGVNKPGWKYIPLKEKKIQSTPVAEATSMA